MDGLRSHKAVSIGTGFIGLLLFAVSAFAVQAPGVQWRRTDWFPTHPVTGPQTQAMSGEDWWYDHKNSYDGSHALQGHITAGYSTFVNWTPTEWPSGGCVASTLNEPNCDDFESAGNVKGEIAATMALIDPTGTNRFWFKTYNLGLFFRVIQTSDGGYLATGTSFSTRDFNGQPIYYNPGQSPGNVTDSFDLGNGCPLTGGDEVPRVSLVKTDALGNLQWQYTYGMQPYRDANGVPHPDDAYNARGLGWNLIETSSGNFIVVGETLDLQHPTGCGDDSPLSRDFLLEVTPDGHWVSGQFLGPTDGPSNISAIAKLATATGDRYVISSNEWFNDPKGCPLFQRVVAREIDGTPAHSLLWLQTNFDIPVPENETLNQRTDSVEVGSSGEILLPIIEKCDGCLYASFNTGLAKVFRLNGSGEILDASEVGTVTAYDLKLGVVPTSDGGFATVSSQQVTPPPAPFGCYSTSFWNTDAFVSKFNAAGVREWSTTFDSSNAQAPYPGDEKKQECMYSISQSQDGGFVVAGNNSSNFDDDYLAKLDPAPLPSGPALSIQDTPVDSGLEPNPDTGPMWVSDDIWVRNQDDQGTVHQNPQYKPAGFNYIYVRITNRGDAPASGVLKIYWAKASTGLSWPTQWDQYMVGTILFGDQIRDSTSLVPITVPITDLGPHASLVVSVPWKVPNPQDFVSFGADKGHFCLLARLETADTAPFGMTSPEGADVYQNTRNNRQIAWKNVSVLDGPMKQGVVLVRNVSQSEAKIRLGFNVSRPNNDSLATFLDYGTVDVALGKDLFSRWTSGGRVGKGFTVLESQKLIRLVDPNAWIGGIDFKPDEMKPISATLVLCNLSVSRRYCQPMPPAASVHFDILQYSTVLGQERLVGGQRFVLVDQGTAQGPDLSITLSHGGAPVAPGGTLLYTLTYSNAGKAPATGVVLAETVPANTTFQPNASTAGWACVPSNSAGSSCALAIGSLAAGGGSHTATFAVILANPLPAGVSQIANTAGIADDGVHGTDPVPGNNLAQDTAPVNLVHLNPPSGRKTLSSSLRDIAWRMVWINNQNSASINVQITDPIPTGTTYVAGSLACSPQGSSTTTTCSYDSGQNRIVWQGTLGADAGAGTELAAANEVVITFHVIVAPAVNRVENQATALTDTNGNGDFSDEDPAIAGSTSNVAVWDRLAEIPTLSPSGLIALFGLLAATGWWTARRRRVR